MRRVSFLSCERLVHADSGERGEPMKKKRVRDRETCNGKLGGSPGRRGGLWCAVYRVRAGAAAMAEGWVPTWSLGPVRRPVLQLSSLRISVMGQGSGRRAGTLRHG